MNVPEVFTIGHSNHSLEKFIELLRLHKITALADVRSAPYSRSNPDFNREFLKTKLAEADIDYVFLGQELGARPEDPRFYQQGRVQYRVLAQSPLFRDGLGLVLKGAKSHRLALLCAEKEPLECHRTLLVARELVALGASVVHIHADGSLETYEDAMKRLIKMLGLPDEDLFRNKEEMIADACALQEERIAYVNEELRQEAPR
jgi:uncharacterized protein (DUF488 family)